MTRRYLFSVILLLCAASAAAQAATNCSYLFTIKTGNQENAGTDGLINLVFGEDTQFPYEIVDLPNYGTIVETHVYFQRDQIDNFKFDGPCDLRCPLDLQYTFRGSNPDWYVDYFIIAGCLSEGPLMRFVPVNKWFTGGYDHFRVDFCQNRTYVPAFNAGLAMPS